jgi:cell wall-associated NlpC family hydrolase
LSFSQAQRGSLLALALVVNGWLLSPASPASATPNMVEVWPADEACAPASLTADFAARDRLPQAVVPDSQWYEQNWNAGWGPRAAAYPAADVPPGCDPVAWKRARVVAAAQRYLGLAYRHHHVPGWQPTAALAGAERAGAGLDCSNFSAWVYNYALGIQFTSDVQQQANGPRAPGRLLAPDEPLAPGDLLYILRGNRADVSHVVIYVDETTVIDSRGSIGGVTEHPMTGWYRTHFSHARRVIE